MSTSYQMQDHQLYSNAALVCCLWQECYKRVKFKFDNNRMNIQLIIQFQYQTFYVELIKENIYLPTIQINLYASNQIQQNRKVKLKLTILSFQQQELIITTTEPNKQMLDIYLIITPIAGLLLLLTVLNIKLTFNEPRSKDLQKYEKRKKDQVKEDGEVKKNGEGQQERIQHEAGVTEIIAQVKEQVKDSQQQSGLKKALIYLLKHWTPLQLFLVRRPRNSIPSILSTCLISLLSILINIPFAFCFINTILTMVFLLGKILSDNNQEQQSSTMIYPDNRQNGLIESNKNEKVKKHERFEHKLDVIFTLVSIVCNVAFIGVVYKNYRNQFLISVVENILITCAVDNFVIKPVVLTITAFFIHNILFIDQFIDKEIQIIEIIHKKRILKKSVDYHISSLSPKKMVSSPSKVPKAVRVEPRIIVQSTDEFISRLSLTKSHQRPKISPISGQKLQHQNNIQGDCSLLSIMNSHEKKINNTSQQFQFDKQLFQQKVQQQQKEQPAIPQVQEVDVGMKKQQQIQQHDEIKQKQHVINEEQNKSKRSNSKLIMISHDNSIIDNLDGDNGEGKIQQQGKDNIDYDDGHQNNKSMRDSGEYNTILSANNKHEEFKLSLHGSIHDHLSGRQHFEDFFEVDRYNHLRPQTFQEETSILGTTSVAASSGRNGLLKINEDRKAEDLEEIDLNSPQRRKQQLKKVIEDSQIPKKKKKNQKKYSLDPNRYVIKHSTGEPYLEFLPNLLNKQRQEKKKKSSSINYGSQNTFSRKVDLLNGNQLTDMRVSKSVKRPKNSKDFIMKENDQNKVPQFTIEEY